MAEPGLQRPDGETLAVVFLFAERLDGRALDDKHCGGPPGGALLGKELDDQRLADGHVDVLAHRQVADRDLEAIRAGF